VVRTTERTTLRRARLRARLSLPAGLARHSNSTWARIVNVTPSGGAEKAKVQPAWRRERSAGPA
jgi:hypothetical protein